MAIFRGETGSADSPFSGPPPSVLEDNLMRISGLAFSQAGCPSCHPTVSVKTLNGT